MGGEFDPEQPTNPGARRTLVEVYDVAQKAVDLGMSNAVAIGVMNGKLDKALAPVSFPRAPLWAMVGALVLIAVAILGLQRDAGASREHPPQDASSR